MGGLRSSELNLHCDDSTAHLSLAELLTAAPNPCSLHERTTLIGESRTMAAEEWHWRSGRARELTRPPNGMLQIF